MLSVGRVNRYMESTHEAAKAEKGTTRILLSVPMLDISSALGLL